MIKLNEASENSYSNTDYCKRLQELGLKATSLVISDIESSKEIEDERQKLLKAEVEIDVTKKNAEKVKIENEILIAKAEAQKAVAVLEAEAEKLGQVLKGEGQADQIKKLIDAGISEEEATDLLINYWKWKALEKGNNNVTLIEGADDGKASEGAKFGAGFMSIKK